MDSVVAALDAVPNLGVYRGRGPRDPNASVPYVVLNHAGLTVDGPANSPHADFYPAIQLTSVGDTSEQAELAADWAREAIYGVLVPPAGRAWIGPVDHQTTTPTQRDEDTNPALFYLASIFILQSTPA